MICAVCDSDLENDLFASVAGTKLCFICTIVFIGGGAETDRKIQSIREFLCLADGEHVQGDSIHKDQQTLNKKVSRE